MSTATQRAERVDAQRNRQKILETADRLFAERGTLVTLGEIATAAGVGAGTVYRHFPTKDALLATVLDQRTDRITEQGRVMRAEYEPGEAFFAFLQYVSDEALDNRDICEALALRDEWRRPLKLEGRCVIDSPLASLLREAQQVGAVRADLEPEDARALMLGFVAMAQSLGSRERAHHMAEVLWGGLRTDPERNTDLSYETRAEIEFRDETRSIGSNETDRRCPVCGDPIEAAGTGRPPKFCGAACRQKSFRAKRRAADEAAAR